MNRIYRFLGLLVILMAATVTMFSALADDQSNEGCSADGTMIDEGRDTPIGIGDAAVWHQAPP